MTTSISIAYSGFEGNLINWAARWIAVIVGMVIVYSFAASRYNVPTFAKTSIGPVGQLSPKLLAPDSRYQKGFAIYFSLLLLLYFALCVIGPKILDIPGVSIPENWKDSTLWPIGAASVLVTVGLAGDNRFPGNIENFFRRKAHEAAYIPTAFATLSHQLASFHLAEWRDKIKKDPRTCDSIRAMSGAESKQSLFSVVQLREGNIVSWVRGNALLHCLGQLSGEQYGAIKAQDENRDAAKLLAVLHESIRTRIGTWADPSVVKIDAQLAKDIESFIDGASVLLASTLLQATPDARDLSATIKKFEFAEIDSTGPQTWAHFAALGVGLLCAATLAVWIVAFLFSETKWFGIDEIPNYSARINRTASSTAIVYSVAFFVLMYVRERRINRKQWDERLGSQVDIVLWGGVPAALAATGTILFLPYIENLQGVLSILAFNLAVGLIAAAFFVIHMRSAARTKEGFRHLAKGLAGPGTFVHTGVALTVAVILTFVTMKFNYEYYPSWSLAAAQVQLNAVMDKARGGGVPSTGESTAKAAPGATTNPINKSNTESALTVKPVNSATEQASETIRPALYWKLETEFRKLSNMMQTFDGRKTDGKEQSESVPADESGQQVTTDAKRVPEDVVGVAERQVQQAPTVEEERDNVAAKQVREMAGIGKKGVPADGGNVIVNEIGLICNLVSKLPASANLVDGSCHPVESGSQDSDLPKAIVGFARGLETLRQDVNNLLEFRNKENTYKYALFQVAIAGVFALFVSLTFGLVVRFGRVAQLRNDIDRFDDETINDLKQRADRYFKEKGKPVEIEKWLTEPNQTIGLMTPLEGVRYRHYRSSLFDSFRPKSVDPVGKGTNPRPTSVNARAGGADASSVPDIPRASGVAPPTAPDLPVEAADLEAKAA